MATTEPRPPRRIAPWLVGSLITLLIAAIAAVHSPLFGLDEIRVSGQRNAEVRQRVADLGVGEGALLVWIDTDAIAQAVVADPWVARVEVSRVLPSTLSIEVAERREAFAVASDGAWMIVASDGVVVATQPGAPDGVPLVGASQPAAPLGTRPETALWDELVGFVGALEESVAPTVAVRMESTGEWWATIAGADVRLGALSKFADKALTAQVLISDGVPAGWVVDVVSPIRPTLVDPNYQPEVEGTDS